jgi:multisubunit Na+/H+ antiporter MnhC subunit
MALRWLSKNPAHKYTNPATQDLILTRIIVELVNERD